MSIKKFYKTISYSFILFITLSSFQHISTIKVSAKEKPEVVFSVVSDVHIEDEASKIKLENALKDIKNVVPNYKALILVGDSTNRGEEYQYDMLMNALMKNKNIGSKVFITMGNHEYYAEGLDELSCRNRFLNKTCMPSLYYDKWVKGYHFIMLAPESKMSANISIKQLEWLELKLKENEKKDKPIFVFLHQPFKDTVFGSELWGEIGNDSELYNVLKKHPQVMFFSGHSHYSLENQNNMCKKDFTMFNTASVNYIMKENDKNDDPFFSQGLIVEVFKDKVIVKGREFSKSDWIGKGYEIRRR